MCQVKIFFNTHKYIGRGGHVAKMKDSNRAIKILNGKCTENRPTGEPRSRILEWILQKCNCFTLVMTVLAILCYRYPLLILIIKAVFHGY